MRLLLDTHILLRWLIDSKRLSRPQSRAIEEAMRRGEPVAVSAITLLEIAMLAHDGVIDISASVDEFFETALAGNPAIILIPLSYGIASLAGGLKPLRDPADRTIVATALVHKLRLVTSDSRIIESDLVPVVE